MAASNGSGRSEHDRLMGKPIKLFSVLAKDGSHEISIPLLPATLALDWVAIYEAAQDLQNDFIRTVTLWEARRPEDFGKEGEPYKTQAEWRTAFAQLKRDVVDAYANAYWKYGELCAEFTGKGDPLKPDVTRDRITSGQVMDALARMSRYNDPLSCLGDSRQDLEVERLAALSPSVSQAQSSLRR